jgi:hypothetical protein
MGPMQSRDLHPMRWELLLFLAFALAAVVQIVAAPGTCRLMDFGSCAIAAF